MRKSSNNEDPDELNGDQLHMGEVGVTLTSGSSAIAGVSNFTAVITSLNDGVSSYIVSATVTNVLIKNMVAGFPGITINGDQVSIMDMKLQQTKDGIKCISGSGSGVLVKYESEAGNTYPIWNTHYKKRWLTKPELTITFMAFI